MANVYRNIFIRNLTEILGEESAKCRTRSGKILRAASFKFDDRREEVETNGIHPDALHKAAIYTYFARRQDLYACKAAGQNAAAYSITLRGWFGMPKVVAINTDGWTGKPGETIYIKARDNARVAGVSVVIRDAEGKVLETGEAVPSKTGSAWWKYTTKTHILKIPSPRIKATAWDLAGNCDSFVIS